MLWPEPLAPLLPVALKEPESQGAEGTGKRGGQRRLKMRGSHMPERKQGKEREARTVRRHS